MRKYEYSDARSNRAAKEENKIRVTRGFLEKPMEMQEALNAKLETLENLNAMICRVTSRVSAAPSGSHNPHAREGLIAKKLDLEKEIQQFKNRLEETTTEVALCILSLDNPDWQKALQYVFLDGMTNSEAADLMHVVPRSVQRYVADACLAMRLPERYYRKNKTAV